MLSDDPAHALLLGRMGQEGDTPLALLPLAAGARAGLGGTGALAVSATRLWLSQPQLVGGPSVASVPLSGVGALGVRARRGPLGGGWRLELAVEGRVLRFTTRAERAAVDAFARALQQAAGG
ncbi:hypothetical protein GTQ99_21280 [Kineococcus sp. T13]|uniref:hypothetical protein n=1 Tax=Kineococcus vitellinus TaxID=2696565 RepID=UPI0014129B64|nr:hypothetical protein [Kineococcus vitellinus]NAZ77920.1 hypothetical protein [Kineococcus vitellinus]